MLDEGQLDQLRDVTRVLEVLRNETNSPAVAMALRHAVYYCHLASGFLGDDGLGPEIDHDDVRRDVSP